MRALANKTADKDTHKLILAFNNNETQTLSLAVQLINKKSGSRQSLIIFPEVQRSKARGELFQNLADIKYSDEKTIVTIAFPAGYNYEEYNLRILPAATNENGSFDKKLTGKVSVDRITYGKQGN